MPKFQQIGRPTQPVPDGFPVPAPTSFVRWHYRELARMGGRRRAL